MGAWREQQRMHRRVRECGVDKRGLGEEDLVKVWEDVLNNFEARVRQRWVQVGAPPLSLVCGPPTSFLLCRSCPPPPSWTPRVGRASA